MYTIPGGRVRWDHTAVSFTSGQSFGAIPGVMGAMGFGFRIWGVAQAVTNVVLKGNNTPGNELVRSGIIAGQGTSVSLINEAGLPVMGVAEADAYGCIMALEGARWAALNAVFQVVTPNGTDMIAEAWPYFRSPRPAELDRTALPTLIKTYTWTS